MPKYRFDASYTAHGEEGLRSKGGTDRRDAGADAVRSVGGEVECLYFEFGDTTSVRSSIFPTTKPPQPFP